MTNLEAKQAANKTVQAVRLAALRAKTEIAAVGFATLPIGTARAVIAASKGLLTWSEAGETHARVVVALDPTAEYPAL